MTVEAAKAIPGRKGGGIPGYVPPANNGYVPVSGLRDNPPATGQTADDSKNSSWKDNFNLNEPVIKQKEDKKPSAGELRAEQRSPETPKTN